MRFYIVCFTVLLGVTGLHCLVVPFVMGIGANGDMGVFIVWFSQLLRLMGLHCLVVTFVMGNGASKDI